MSMQEPAILPIIHAECRKIVTFAWSGSRQVCQSCSATPVCMYVFLVSTSHHYYAPIVYKPEELLEAAVPSMLQHEVVPS